MSKDYQETLLTAIRWDNISLLIRLTDGARITGLLRAFDNNVLIVESPDGKQQMIYKHAISTIVPDIPINIKG